ncbi:hypothetical protein COW36_16425 [bacterium (Candidatus Blackallbacteria) CG17_big_fil_post_rev_8_21_14_2_50_48_46]|uniref:Uncharacterized protein n=1 Tax=bacterium (Candidatus Blackallbacteria) CG17_big_fil_post_rev_8_21_14_2_50_48_46 TaxID=2014261 RepID=A0A2M7G1M3_9BACT|nr:MAG: hypothetical protein COW64_07015 [bacterium (Candidatus Blackallbacteria) CG18_big_fil_WC_8_21_14_2_50_49_26]PIW15622.1 MAG: hypothetical protein COW36_16425 [bacterium (Candidatus Blackallbacteria) CG17_big_fil_post_rev_8_21_14_2_50_48_46]PIW48106.1 MAG: hypothetical protein COW20_10580 [bacterium (Candidatus Blackallbacteria) CG13_big_fil_rev_8_21_14_2_50_49_14]
MRAQIFSLSAVLGLVFWSASAFSTDFPVQLPSREDYKPILRREAFNQTLKMAQIHKEAWTRHPFLIALRFVGEIPEAPQRSVEYFSMPEKPALVRVVITDQGFLDDSIQSSRYRIYLEYMSPGFWYVTRAEEAWRCQPNRGHQNYSTQACH